MKQKQDQISVGSIIKALLSLAVMGWMAFSMFSPPNVKGTYTWEFNGPQEVVISTKGDRGPCLWTNKLGTYNESYFLWETRFDRPILEIEDVVYIDIKNSKCYRSESDIKAYRNPIQCRITR